MKGFLKKDDYRLRFAPPKKNIKVDILVVGGGLEGITTAFLAAEKGFNVAVAERFFIGSGRTSFMQGCLTPNLKTADATKKYDEHTKLITSLAKESGGLSVSRLPFFFFSEKPLNLPTEANFFNGEELSEFNGSVPDGAIFRNGALSFSPVFLCKALAERSRLSGAQIFERTSIVSVFDKTATTDSGVEITFKTLVNTTGKGENAKRRFLLRAEFVGEKLPHLVFGDTEFCPLTAVSKDGKTLDVALTARTKAGAFFEKKRLGESLAAILPVCPAEKRSYIGECRGDYSVAGICERCLCRESNNFGLS